MSKKLNTRSIFERNQSRATPAGFGHTVIWLHNIRSMHNIGSVFRSADAFGVREIILSGYTPAPPRAEISKTALGAEQHVPWKYFQHVEPALDYLRSGHYTLVGLEQTDASVMIGDLRISAGSKICLVFGNEITGIDDEILPELDHVAEIPQYGRKHSLNVSVAAGIALFSLHEHFRNQE